MSLEGSELYGDTSASMADSDTVDSLNSTAPMRPTGTKSSQKEQNPPKFKAWSFRLTIKADFAGAVDKEKRLKEHISERTTIERPFCVTSQIAFYDTVRGRETRGGERRACAEGDARGERRAGRETRGEGDARGGRRARRETRGDRPIVG